MKIGELAQRSGLTTKTIRFYESTGLLASPARTAAGYREFDEAALDRLTFIKSAQACGLTLAEAREIITVRAQSGPPCGHVRTLLDRHAHEVRGRIADLTLLLAELDRLQARAATLDDAACGDADVCHVIAPA